MLQGCGSIQSFWLEKGTLMYLLQLFENWIHPIFISHINFSNIPLALRKQTKMLLQKVYIWALHKWHFIVYKGSLKLTTKINWLILKDDNSWHCQSTWWRGTNLNPVKQWLIQLVLCLNSKTASWKKQQQQAETEHCLCHT